jgi:hypothetical protein
LGWQQSEQNKHTCVKKHKPPDHIGRLFCCERIIMHGNLFYEIVIVLIIALLLTKERALVVGPVRIVTDR